MKLHHFALTSIALAAGAATTTAANAQQAPTGTTSSTSVQIYGVVDAYVQHARGASSLTRVQSGGLNGSRFGLRGSEDLGGGLRAIFTIESGLNVDDGSFGQGAFWGRQAFVGIASPYGQLTLGRQYGSIYTLSSDFSEFSNGPIGASTAVIGGFGGYEPVRGSATTATGNGGPARNNNSVKVETPSFSGFKAGALVGLGEVTGGTNETRIADVYGRYTAGPLDVMVSLQDDKSAAASLDVRTISAAAAYQFGDFHVTGGVISVDDRNAITNVDGDGYWVGGNWRSGANLFKAQYVVSKLKEGDGKTQAFGVGYQLDLSKRTALYSSLTQFKNEGAGYTNRWATSLPASLTSATDRNITELAAGIRHTF